MSVSDYRFLSKYCDSPEKIVPENVGHTVIDELLNPYKYRSYYGDKNMFDILLGGDKLPVTIMRRINGGPILDEKYQKINNLKKYLSGYGDVLILKPSVDSDSGIGVTQLKKKEDFYYDTEGRQLNEDYLNSFGSDFVLQKCVQQSEFMNHLNPTSVNTIRLYVYKSLVDEEPHVVGGVVRVGKSGSYVDNAHAGGRFVGIDVNTGRLGKMTFDADGGRERYFNGLDFENEEFVVPEWEMVLSFAKNVANRLIHMHYIALDIALEEENKPTLIEYNIAASSFWLCMYTNQSPFGKYTDEIIDYCLKKKKNK